MSTVKISTIAAIFVLAATPSVASTVIYDESVDGDLAHRDSRVLSLSSGINRVLGSWEFSSANEDFDDFLVSIDIGSMLTGITFTASNWVDAADNIAEIFVRYELFSDSHDNAPSLGTQEIDPRTSAAINTFDTVLPLSSGTYAMDWTDQTIYLEPNSGFDWGASWDYEWAFTVESRAVPEINGSQLGIGLTLLLSLMLLYREREGFQA